MVTGSQGNYSLSASVTTSQGTYFSSPSFSKSTSGMSGGADPGQSGALYDSGTYTVTVNSLAKQVTYGQSSTTATIASAVASAFNGDSTSSVTASVSGSSVTFTAKATGASTNYAWSVASATTQSGFSGSSFSASSTSGSLTGGADSYTAPASLYNFALTFNPNGDIATGNDSVNGNWTYGYDDFNRLGSAAKSGGSTYAYGYDRYGNRWTNGVGQSLSFQPTNNQLASGNGVTYDAAGNIIQDGSNSYTYDAENRLVGVNGITYVYYADGRRVAKLLSGGDRYDFLFDLSNHIITELYNGTWNRGEVFAAGRHLATYTRGKTYFPETDWLGTARFTANQAGLGTESCNSLPFGDGQGCSGSDTASSPEHFTGKERDLLPGESGLDYFGARYHSSSVGRFLSPDPENAGAELGDPQSWNAYPYVGNDPLNSTDPTGMVKCKDGKEATVCVEAPAQPIDTLTQEWIYTSIQASMQAMAQLNRAAQFTNQLLDVSRDWWGAPRDQGCLYRATGGGAMVGGTAGAAAALVDGPGVVISAPAGFLGGGALGWLGGMASCKSGSGGGGSGSGSSSGTTTTSPTLSNRVQGVLKQIQQGTTKGKPFLNTNGQLPAGTYRSYTVPSGTPGRGAERLVVEQSTGAVYHTTDHYATFVRIQ